MRYKYGSYIPKKTFLSLSCKISISYQVTSFKSVFDSVSAYTVHAPEISGTVLRVSGASMYRRRIVLRSGVLQSVFQLAGRHPRNCVDGSVSLCVCLSVRVALLSVTAVVPFLCLCPPASLSTRPFLFAFPPLELPCFFQWSKPRDNTRTSHVTDCCRPYRLGLRTTRNPVVNHWAGNYRAM